MSFTLSGAVNPLKVFLASRSELSERFDPEMVLFRRKARECKYPVRKAKAEGKDVANMLLFLDESVANDKDKSVGFNLQGIKQLRFKKPEVEFAPLLRENLKKFFEIES